MKTEREWRQRRPDGWDQTDTHLLRRFYSTLPIEEVCWLLDRSKLAIFNRAHVLGLKKTPAECLSDYDRVREELFYDAETGIFTWRNSGRGRTKRQGHVAGSACGKGYVRIKTSVGEKFAHRLAWLGMTGEWPPEEIDHINGIRNDNRFCNLRAATVAQNRWNNAGQPKRRVHSSFKGVTKEKGSKRWKAQIMAYGKLTVLGYFDHEEDAAQAYRGAAVQLHGEFAKW